MGATAESMQLKLQRGLDPEKLEIVDRSDRHVGHAGARDGGESHFDVVVVAAAFTGLSRVQRQRLVYGLLADELAGPVHALALVARSPGEA